MMPDGGAAAASGKENYTGREYLNESTTASDDDDDKWGIRELVV